MKLTHLGKAVYAADKKAQYDDAVKEIIADKQILAWILKYTTSEFSAMDIKDIIPLIENPAVSRICVEPGLTNDRITGLPTESKIVGEDAVYYDIRFFVSVPGENKADEVRIIVDVEAQKDPSPGYDIVTRGVLYGGRMLSEQMGRNVKHSDYDALQKVYSIWIVFNCNQKEANTISLYRMNHRALYGNCPDKERYDLLDVVLIRLPKKGESEKAKNKPTLFQSLLYDIFVREMDTKEKLRMLRDRYDIHTDSLERRINAMCNLSDLVVENTIRSEIKRMLNNGKTPEQIHEFCDYPLEMILEIQSEMSEEE